MKVKALISFSGVISMYEGEVRDINNDDILKDLTSAGYIEPVVSKRGTKNESKRIDSK